MLNSKAYVPQNRERIFIIGHLRGISPPEVFPVTGNGGESDKITGKIRKVGSTKGEHNTRIGDNDYVYADNGICGALKATDYKQPKQVAIKQIGNIVDEAGFGNPQRGRVYSADGMCPTLNTCSGGGHEIKIAIPVLTPDRAEKRQNGRRFKTDGEEMFCITAQDRHGVIVCENQYDENGKQRPQHDRVYNENGIMAALTAEQNGRFNILNGMAIRKLTPLECFRLQGFPDELFDKAQAVNSDSQLYKQAGNAVSVPVIYEIAKRLEKET